MGTGAGQTPASNGGIPFFARRRRLQIFLSVLTAGVWLLVPLTVWLWRRGQYRLAGATGIVYALVLALLISAIAGGTKAESESASASGHLSLTQRKAADAQAEEAIALALKHAASDYQDFGGYTLFSTRLIGNTDHRLRRVPHLYATGTHNTFLVSVRSRSGTTFAVHGSGLALRPTCSPAGPSCEHGTWSGPTHLALPKVPQLTAQQKSEVRSLLEGSVDHYAHVLAAGERALGSTQYASAFEGLAAFKDPNSAASRFSAYRKQYSPETDISYNTAFGRAEKYYTAANEPRSLVRWQEDVAEAAAHIGSWSEFAAGWQIHQHTTAPLHAAERHIEAELTKARSDVAHIMAGR